MHTPLVNSKSCVRFLGEGNHSPDTDDTDYTMATQTNVCLMCDGRGPDQRPLS